MMCGRPARGDVDLCPECYQALQERCDRGEGEASPPPKRGLRPWLWGLVAVLLGVVLWRIPLVVSAFERPSPRRVGVSGTDRKTDEFKTIRGRPPSLVAPPAGCRFHPRCSQVMSHCETDTPPVVQLGNGRQVRCLLYGEEQQ